MSKILFIQQAPQNCTWTTKNLLHFDMYSQKMYKCNGYMWTVWDSDDPADSPRGLAPAPSLCLIGKSSHSFKIFQGLNDHFHLFHFSHACTHYSRNCLILNEQ